MAGAPTKSTEWPIRIEGNFDHEHLFVIAARVEEGFNQITSGVVEFATHDDSLRLEDMVGEKMRIVLRDLDENTREFPGTCISVEYLGSEGQHSIYSAEFRSWFWFMSRTMENKVFQEMTSLDIFDKVLKDGGYGDDVEINVSDTLPTREYTIQYRESDLDFINRLFEEDGLYYYFENKDGKDTLFICDNSGAHDDLEGGAEVEFRPNDGGNRVQFPHVYEWLRASKATSGKVSLMDYDFTKPSADLKVENSIAQGHTHSSYEFYDYPGHYRDASAGERLARIRMEAEAVRHQTVQATGNIHNAQVGRAFSLIDHLREQENADYVISKAIHRFRQVESDLKPRDSSLGWADDESDPYSTSFEAFPKDVQYRAPAVTPWPEISGIHTAVVVGPPGDEIYTDEHGRIKVQFHWDRHGDNDETSSCFVRCMMPWTGKGWGMIHIPRIGQEVVIQFEEGNPDRPLVSGMLYNADTMPPYKLPDNQTQSGFTTRSTKSGSTETFHELMFEDKKDKELVRFQSERDYKQIVKNNAEIEIGLKHKDKGDLTQTIHRNKTVTLNTGDLTTEVKDGNEDRKIKKNKTEEVGNNYELTVKGNQTDKITKTLKVSANQKIELKCGGSKITLEPAKITIQSVQVEIKGSAQTKVNGGAMLDLSSGGMIKAGAPLIKLN